MKTIVDLKSEKLLHLYKMVKEVLKGVKKIFRDKLKGFLSKDAGAIININHVFCFLDFAILDYYIAIYCHIAPVVSIVVSIDSNQPQLVLRFKKGLYLREV